MPTKLSSPSSFKPSIAVLDEDINIPHSMRLPTFSDLNKGLTAQQHKIKLHHYYKELYELLTSNTPEKSWKDFLNSQRLNHFLDNSFLFVQPENASTAVEVGSSQNLKPGGLTKTPELTLVNAPGNAKPSIAHPSINDTTNVAIPLSSKLPIPLVSIESLFFDIVNKIKVLSEFDVNYHYTINTSKKTNLLALSIRYEKIFNYLLDSGANNTSPVITVVPNTNKTAPKLIQTFKKLWSKRANSVDSNSHPRKTTALRADSLMTFRDDLNLENSSFVVESEHDTVLTAILKYMYPIETIKKVLSLPQTNINYQNVRGDSALHSFCGLSEDLTNKIDPQVLKTYTEELLECLVGAGADVVLRNKINHMSPLELAFKNKNFLLADLLVERYGALTSDSDQIYLRIFSTKMGNTLGQPVVSHIKKSLITAEHLVLEQKISKNSSATSNQNSKI